ncbi:MAG: monofunctional biosynthetic peptidoglycan transglycosylase [Muribaculaceae bacterium]|nr:monofunctional biosynthetic peptidoglycan transglycosylase [Muribaculaceae bacterium]MCF0205329.1 monofunctional biosynthetic peptidoglycan transglycosylase [Muribaculaceae bacterium]
MRKLMRILLCLVALFFGSTLLAVVALKWVPVYYTPLMFTRLIDQKSEGKELKLSHSWVPLNEISENLSLAVIASEDQRFMEHSGFDFEQINKAIDEANAGKRQRGASTISQQTAKNVFLWQGHSWIRKGLEAYFTLLIEWVWGKERIIEVYLNSIEMGDGIYGAQAVAEEHFGKNAAKLTRAESALIAATLPSPLKRNSARPSSYMLKRRQQILRQMRLIHNPHLGTK